MTLKVIIDTNFLLIPGKFMIDIFEEIKNEARTDIELLTLDRVIEELEKLSNSKETKLKDRNAAKLGLALLKQKNLKIEHCSRQHTDDAIIEKALEFKDQGFFSAIATVDKELISRALSSKIWVFALRQKKKILLLK